MRARVPIANFITLRLIKTGLNRKFAPKGQKLMYIIKEFLRKANIIIIILTPEQNFFVVRVQTLLL